jgi:hypothetical protein
MLHVLYIPYIESPNGDSIADNWFPSYSIKPVFKSFWDLKKEGYYFNRFYIFTIFSDEEVESMNLIWEREKNINGQKIMYTLHWDGKQYIVSFWKDYYNHFSLYCFKKKDIPTTVALGFRYIYRTWF